MFPFGHLIFAWAIGLLIQKVGNIKLSRLSWGLLFFGSLLPDIDFLFNWMFGLQVHRTFTHSLVFVLVGFFVAYLAMKNYKVGKEAFFVAVGIFSHTILDMFSWPGTLLFWPFGTWFHVSGLNNLVMLAPTSIQTLSLEIILLYTDIVLGLIWLSYLYLKRKLKFS